MKNNVIAIDTGSNGGVSIYKDGIFYCTPFVDIKNTKDFVLLHCGEKIKEFTCIIESLNIFSNVNGSKNTVYKQGVSFGSCIGLLFGLGIENIVEVSARKWQSYLNIPKGIDYKERKMFLKSKAEELFPELMGFKSTKKYKESICDSLLILNYFLNYV